MPMPDRRSCTNQPDGMAARLQRAGGGLLFTGRGGPFRACYDTDSLEQQRAVSQLPSEGACIAPLRFAPRVLMVLVAVLVAVKGAGAAVPGGTGTVFISDGKSDGHVLLNASTVVRDYVLDAGLGPLGDRNASYALADTTRFARASWDCGAWGTQGAVIVQKLLSLGTREHQQLVRRWLLNNPQLPSGEVFSTEGSRFHMGQDGKWEANAEFILGATHYARHGSGAAVRAQPAIARRPLR